MKANDYHVTMDALVSLCKRRGFIFQTSEIYGGINGFWDYGPLGVELGLAVAVHVAPQRRHAVEIAPALGVDQVVALAPFDDQRRLGQPVAHLGERMPEA